MKVKLTFADGSEKILEDEEAFNMSLQDMQKQFKGKFVSNVELLDDE